MYNTKDNNILLDLKGFLGNRVFQFIQIQFLNTVLV